MQHQPLASCRRRWEEKRILIGQLTKSERVNSTKSKADGSSRPLLSR